MEKAIINTPLGITEIQGDENGISKIYIREEAVEITLKIPSELEEAAIQLQEYFEGKRTHFTFLLHPSGTEFQKKVWQELLNIPFGKTCSYLELSKKLGDVKAIRAVAAANGSLTGYAGGLWRKKWLLEHENPSVQKTLF